MFAKIRYNYLNSKNVKKGCRKTTPLINRKENQQTCLLTKNKNFFYYPKSTKRLSVLENSLIGRLMICLWDPINSADLIVILAKAEARSLAFCPAIPACVTSSIARVSLEFILNTASSINVLNSSELMSDWVIDGLKIVVPFLITFILAKSEELW
jgi:hypothetical protein